VYAFSIDNYKRTAEEVDTLMILAEEKLIELSREEEKLGEKGICVKVLGDLSLAPRAVRAAAERVMQATEKNSSCTLNICFSYTYVHEFCSDSWMTFFMS
jgi:ditrans,polycis-polyprenyl diphosphate synthase